jgi:hypothetical protein
MNVALLLPLFLFALQDDSKKEEHLLKPLAQINESLDRGILEWFKGTPVEEAFKGFKKVTLKDQKLRDTLKEGGVVSATSAGIEVDIDLAREGKAVYRLKLFVHFNGDQIEFIQFGGRESDSTRPSSYLATEDFPEPHRGLGRSFEAFVKVLQGENAASHVRFIDMDSWAKKIPAGGPRENIRKSTDRSREGVSAVLTEVKKVKYDAVHARVDDQSYFALGEDGSWLGVIRSELELDKKMGLSFQLQRYKPFE